MDDERLKNPPGPGVPDYFDELLERIRDIRSSERRMYTRVRDILALAADYQPSHAETQSAFRVVQNKLHFAATGMTAPELIAARADAAKPNMGLSSWKGDVVRKGDVVATRPCALPRPRAARADGLVPKRCVMTASEPS